jgi:hypothetical protein
LPIDKFLPWIPPDKLAEISTLFPDDPNEDPNIDLYCSSDGEQKKGGVLFLNIDTNGLPMKLSSDKYFPPSDSEYSQKFVRIIL